MERQALSRFRWIRRAAIACGATITALLIIEGLLWLFPPAILARLNSLHEILLPHDLLGYVLPSNLRQRVMSEDGKNEFLVETNDFALRDPPYVSDGRQGILGLGDSYLFGDGVNNDETVMAFLQRRMDERRPGMFRTINAGVPGYSTNQEVIYYLAYGDTLFHPRVVLLFFYINDVTVFVSPRNFMGVPVPDLNVIYGEHRRPGLEWQTGKLFRILKKQLEVSPRIVIRPARKDEKMPQEHTMYNRRLYKEDASLHPIFSSMLTTLKTHAESRDARVIFVYVPSAQEIVPGSARERIMYASSFPIDSWDWDLASRIIEHTVKGVGLPFVNLIPSFRAHRESTGRDVFIGGEGHFSPEGCRLAAEIVAAEIEAR